MQKYKNKIMIIKGKIYFKYTFFSYLNKHKNWLQGIFAFFNAFLTAKWGYTL